MGTKQCFTVVFIYITLITNKDERPLTGLLACHVSFSVKCWLNSIAQFYWSGIILQTMKLTLPERRDYKMFKITQLGRNRAWTQSMDLN